MVNLNKVLAVSGVVRDMVKRRGEAAMTNAKIAGLVTIIIVILTPYRASGSERARTLGYLTPLVDRPCGTRRRAPGTH